MPPACPSTAYYKLLRTAGGLTPEDPTGLVASEFDFADWDGLVVGLIARMERAWKVYGDLLPQDRWAQWNEMLPEVDALRTRYQDLRVPWPFIGGGSPVFETDDITKMRDLAVDTACTWERIDARIVELGGNALVPEIAKQPLSLLEKIAIGGLGVGVVLGGFFIYRAVTRKKEVV